ncbi:hypothetical protein LSH36_353g04012 [Paralvinella palmiformis]|uniref:Uncharacterized protein n=1 Tax=Paralvinella palmiformis TaxID=53620 RepID=A0AAD9JG00_9ANNE|nr:hypothetical protein LSH36_353g04012 [Paralvinella palmiformis]
MRQSNFSPGFAKAKSREMTLSKLLQRFGDGTTMHGVPKAIKSHSLGGKIFWSLCCFLATSMFMLQLIQLLQKYYSYPKRVTIEVVPLSISFPSISLCNMRNLDNNIMNRLNKIFKTGNNPAAWQLAVNESDDSFIKEYMKVVSKYYPMFLNEDADMAIFATVLTRTTLATNINKTIVSKAGVPFKEFIVICRFSGIDCNRTRDFVHFFDPYYYNCFTYNAPQPENQNDLLPEGVENGWSTVVLTGSGMLENNEEIRIIPGSHEYLSPMSSSEGVRVVIHPANTTPFPHTEGFDVPPGYSVTFGVKARQNIRIGSPHGNCSDRNPFHADDTHIRYTLIACQKECLQGAIVRECGCKDISLPGADRYPNHIYCNADDILSPDCAVEATPDCYRNLDILYRRYTCVREMKMKMSRNATANILCGCFPACNEITYDVTYSLAKWPAASFDGDEAYIDIFTTVDFPSRFSLAEDGQQKMKMYSNYFDPSNRRQAMKDFSRLNVYIADSNVLKTEEDRDYVQSQLLSDIGGQLGLWVGISVITLAEAFELIVDFFHYLTMKHGPYSGGKNFSRDPDEQESFRPEEVHCACTTCQACSTCKHCSQHHRAVAPMNQYGNGVLPLAPLEYSDPVNLV